MVERLYTSPAGLLVGSADAHGLHRLAFADAYRPCHETGPGEKYLDELGVWLDAYENAGSAPPLPDSLVENLVWTDLADFQTQVLRATLTVPEGTTVTYKDLAEQIGSPKSSRAVGTALSKNPWLVIVPCHRVRPSTGKVGAYAGGTHRKEALLAHEGASGNSTTTDTAI